MKEKLVNIEDLRAGREGRRSEKKKGADSAEVIEMSAPRGKKAVERKLKSPALKSEQAGDNIEYIVGQCLAVLELNASDEEISVLRAAVKNDPFSLFSGEINFSPAIAGTLDKTREKLEAALERQGVTGETDKQTAIIAAVHDAIYRLAENEDCPKIIGSLAEEIEAETARRSTG